MSVVYILYSKKLNKYYTGSCSDLKKRIAEHTDKKYSDSFTAKANDWVLFHTIEGLGYAQARKVEMHIKKMKNKKYIENLKKHPEMIEKLLKTYSNK